MIPLRSLWTPACAVLFAGVTLGQEFTARLMYDAIESGGDTLDDTARFRRQRLMANWREGRFRVRAQAEFAGDARFLELYGELDELPLGSLRVGHFREPQGLEANTSSAYSSFLERAAPIDAFTPGRSQGVRVAGQRGGWGWGAGVFRTADDVDAEHGDGRSFTGRLTRTFGDVEPAETLVHAGLSASLLDPGDDPVRLRARAGTNLAPRLIDTGDLAVRDQQTLGLEAAWRSGPVSVQAESLVTWLDLEQEGSAQLAGTYAQLTYTLTGEGRRYSRSRAAFLGIEPTTSTLEGGSGAWELAARIARTDLSDGSVRGDRQDDYTLGVNWYWTDRARAMLEWVHVEIDEAGEDEDFLLLRLQLGF
ncbi:MAG: hypothetical protein GY711_35750 [bacterium]|nr:hypothetical protein [bacterium]